MASVFLEPAKLFLSMAGNEVAAGDVDVHGYNTYGALLMTATGIQLPRRPFVADDVKGVVDFLAYPDFVPLADAIAAQFGRSLSGSEVRLPLPPVPGNQFIYYAGGTVSQLCASYVPTRQFQLYLDRFLSYFRGEAIAQPLIQHIINRGLIDQLPSQPGQEDIRYWIWEEGERFRLDRAMQLLEQMGVLTDAATVLPSPRPARSCGEWLWATLLHFWQTLLPPA